MLTLLNINLIEEPISENIQSQNWGFILFLICFLITVQSIKDGGRLWSAMLSGLFRENERENLFSEQVQHELITKLLLIIQTSILSSVILYQYYSHTISNTLETTSQLFQFIGGSAILLFILILYKWLSYTIIGEIFHPKELKKRWNDNFFTIVCLFGIILFIPALLIFYIPETYLICYYFSLVCFILILILAIYKYFTLFFQDKRTLLYFILYLCALEIIPLYLTHKGLIHLFNIVQKDTLWIQI